MTTNNTGSDQGGEEATLGHVHCHCSDDDGVPDVGISLGLGEGSALWIGEILSRDGGDIGVVFHGKDGSRIVSVMWPTCEWNDVADIFRHHVAPILSRIVPAHPPERIRELEEEGYRRGVEAAAKVCAEQADWYQEKIDSQTGDPHEMLEVRQHSIEALTWTASAIRSLSPNAGEG